MGGCSREYLFLLSLLLIKIQQALFSDPLPIKRRLIAISSQEETPKNTENPLLRGDIERSHHHFKKVLKF
jgi:hypothetical protein